jgi:hypothetical protein
MNIKRNIINIVLKKMPNKAIKDRPQRNVGWTRKDTRALYCGVKCFFAFRVKAQYSAGNARFLSCIPPFKVLG